MLDMRTQKHLIRTKMDGMHTEAYPTKAKRVKITSADASTTAINVDPFIDMNINGLIVPPVTFPLARLPEELQEMIFDLLVVDTEPITEVGSRQNPMEWFRAGWISAWKPKSPHINANILYASKKYYIEGLKFVYGRNHFCLRIYQYLLKGNIGRIFEFFGAQVTWYDTHSGGQSTTFTPTTLGHTSLIKHIVLLDPQSHSVEDVERGIRRERYQNRGFDLNIAVAVITLSFLKELLWSGMSLKSLSVTFNPTSAEDLLLLKMENQFTSHPWVLSGYRTDQEVVERDIRWQQELVEMDEDIAYEIATSFQDNPISIGHAHNLIEGHAPNGSVKITKINVRGISGDMATGVQCKKWLDASLKEPFQLHFGGRLRYVPLPKATTLHQPFQWFDFSDLRLKEQNFGKLFKEAQQERLPRSKESQSSPSIKSQQRSLSSPSSLLDPKDSILQRIFNHLLISTTPLENPSIRGKLQMPSSSQLISPNILLTCKKLHSIGTTILYENNIFKFTPTCGPHKLTEQEVLSFISAPLSTFPDRHITRANLIRAIILSEETEPVIKQRSCDLWHWEIGVLQALKYTSLDLDVLSLSFDDCHAREGPLMDKQTALLRKRFLQFLKAHEGFEFAVGYRLGEMMKIRKLLLHRLFERDLHTTAVVEESQAAKKNNGEEDDKQCEDQEGYQDDDQDEGADDTENEQENERNEVPEANEEKSANGREKKYGVRDIVMLDNKLADYLKMVIPGKYETVFAATSYY